MSRLWIWVDVRESFGQNAELGCITSFLERTGGVFDDNLWFHLFYLEAYLTQLTATP